MKNNIITGMNKEFAGYGHNKLTIIVDNVKTGEEKEYSCVSSNTMATDWFNDDSEGVKNMREAQKCIVEEVLRANDLEFSYKLSGDLIPLPF